MKKPRHAEQGSEVAKKKSAHLKGRELERAVELIESAILKQNPELNDGDVARVPRKIIEADGVKHEIDLYVEIDRGRGYQAVFIFECRNRKKKVSKNDIVVFSEKIKAANAQRGFFVARGFSKPARAQAAKDSRMELWDVSENFPSSFVDRETIENFHFIMNERTTARATFQPYKRENEIVAPVQLDIAAATVDFRGEEKRPEGFINEMVSTAMQRAVAQEDTKRLDQGTYLRRTEPLVSFKRGELLINGTPMEYMKLEVEFLMKVVPPASKSQFEVSGRGRVHMFDAEPDGVINRIQIAFVEPDPE